MKPPPFEYSDPESLEEAVALLAEHGDDAKILAGGQSFLPLLNFRLARPAHVVDINRVSSLSYIRKSEGTLRIGALTRQSALERAAMVARDWPILPEALSYVGHVQIRNRGTVGGSVAHADPAAELPNVFSALDATFHLTSRSGTRTLKADELFQTHLTTAIRPDELLTEIEVPPLPGNAGWAFTEFARRHGDFALGGAVAIVSARPDGTCERAVISLLAAAPTPLRSREAESLLAGSDLSNEAIQEAVAAATAAIEPTGDIHGSSSYRKHLITVLLGRALEEARDRARNGGERNSA